MSDETYKPLRRARLLDTALGDYEAPPNGRFPNRFQPVAEPATHLCKCGRVIVWDTECLHCQNVRNKPQGKTV
jgi:hypothetical protein